MTHHPTATHYAELRRRRLTVRCSVADICPKPCCHGDDHKPSKLCAVPCKVIRMARCVTVPTIKVSLCGKHPGKRVYDKSYIPAGC